MSSDKKLILDEDVQEIFNEHDLKLVFDKEKQLYSVFSTELNEDGKEQGLISYGIENSDYFNYTLTNHIDDFVSSVKIIKNLKNNDNYKDYDIGLNLDYDGFYVGLEKDDQVNKNKQFGMFIEPRVIDDDVDLTIRAKAFNKKYFDVDDVFSDIKNSSEFSNLNTVSTNYDLTVEGYPYYSQHTVISTHLTRNNGQEVLVKDELYCTHEMKFNDLENTDFLAKPIELFKEKSIVEKYNDILENPKEQDIVNMLIEEKVIDSKRYNELREEKKLDDQNTMFNLFNEIDVIAGESMKTVEKEISSKNEQAFIDAVNSVTNKEQDKGMEL